MKLMRAASVAVPVLLFLLMAYAIAQTAPWQAEGVGGAEDMDEIVRDLFEDHLVAFEVLGVLLTAAMIGALVIARPLVGGLDSDAYPRSEGAELERTQRVSDVGATFPLAAPARSPGTPDMPAPARSPRTPDVADPASDHTVGGEDR